MAVEKNKAGYRSGENKPRVRTPYGHEADRRFAAFLNNEGITTKAEYKTFVDDALKLSVTPSDSEVVAAVKLMAKLRRWELLNEFSVEDEPA